MSAAVMARALLREAGEILPSLPSPHCDAPLAAIDEFVAAPRPWRYLRAVRLLREARRSLRTGQAVTDLLERSFDRGISSMAALSFMSPELVNELRSLPRDSRVGKRLEVLAAMLEAHHELSSRVRQVDASREPAAGAAKTGKKAASGEAGAAATRRRQGEK